MDDKAEKRIAELERRMRSSDFWADKDRAKEAIKESEKLKQKIKEEKAEYKKKEKQ